MIDFGTVSVYSNDHKFRLVWEHIGEGTWGDYDPLDPGDERLLRFTIERRTNEPEPLWEWEAMEDSSYCTANSVETESKDLVNLGKIILDDFLDCYNNGESWRRTMEAASWLTV